MRSLIFRSLETFSNQSWQSPLIPRSTFLKVDYFSTFISSAFNTMKFAENISKLLSFLHTHESPVDGGFNIKNLWSDDMTFSKAGNVLCGKPFPRSDSIRFVTDALAQKDFNDANKYELDAMPSKSMNSLSSLNAERTQFLADYCKQLYRDVASTNNGKITWNYVKPVIQGKILYGPVNPHTKQIMLNVS